MKIIAYTTKAKKLYEEINSKIEEKKLKTWEIKKNTKNEILYNHIPEQWNDIVLMKPIVYEDRLELIVKWWDENEPDETTKGYILGRFTEILMVHFRNIFDYLETK